MFCFIDFNLNFLYFDPIDVYLHIDTGAQGSRASITMTTATIANNLIQNDENLNYFIEHLCILSWLQIWVKFICDILNFLYTFVLSSFFSRSPWVICLVFRVAQIFLIFFSATPCAQDSKKIVCLIVGCICDFLLFVTFYLYSFIENVLNTCVCVCG